MIVGCYSLHLYCDTPNCPNAHSRSNGTESFPPGEFMHETNERGAVVKARRAGWKVDLLKQTCFCPKCTRP